MCKWLKWRKIQCISFKTTNYFLSVHLWVMYKCPWKKWNYFATLYFWIKLYFFTWLIAGSCGQSRHDSCQLFPGVPQAGENGKRESELYWRTSSIYGQALCHWTLQENQVLALINTRFHTIRIGLSHGIVVHLITLLMRKNTALWYFLLQWIYLQWADQHEISDTSV